MMPNFFIVGAPRSGTTSLDLYLSQHPDIYISPKKETHFFAGNPFPSQFTGPGDERLNRLLILDEAQYAQLFACTNGSRAIGEASVFYLSWPGTAERIAQEVPNAKIIILLREPVARAYSAYLLLVRDGRETLGFEESLNREAERKEKGFEPIWWYKELSLYYSQVKRYLDVFGIRQVKVLLYDELAANPGQVLRDIFRFLCVEEEVTIDTSVRFNTSGVPKSRRLYRILDNFIYNPGPLEKRIKSLIPPHVRLEWASRITGMFLRPVSMDPQLHSHLKTFFAEDVGKLEHLLKRDLRSWRTASPATRQKSQGNYTGTRK